MTEKDWDQDSKGPENIESNRKEQDPDRYKEVTDAEKTIVADKEEDASVIETEAKAASDPNDTEDAKKKSEYEDVCFICRRPESKAGKMFKLPNNITVCSDCMHKTMDTVSQFDYMGMLNNPSMMDDLNKSMGTGDSLISALSISMICRAREEFRISRGSKRRSRRMGKSRYWIFIRFRHRTRSRQVWMNT